MWIDELTEQAESPLSSVPASDKWQRDIKAAQEADNTCQQLLGLIRQNWSSKAASIPADLQLYWFYSHDLTIIDDIIFRANTILIPESLRTDTLETIHEGHSGVSKCRQRAKRSIWWPGMSDHIAKHIGSCKECILVCPIPKEPLMSTPLPTLPWKVIRIGLAEREGKTYLVIMDYDSRYPKVYTYDGLTNSENTIRMCKSALFAHHGIRRVP